MRKVKQTSPENTKPSGWSKMVWFVGIWLASVLALTVVGGVIRWVLNG